MPTTKRNPFQPGYGEIPPVLAGRDQLKLELRDRIDATVERERHPTAIALVGPRGCGKTALLGWTAGKAKERKLPVIRLNKEDFAAVGDLELTLSDQVVSPNKSHDFSVEVKDPTGQLGSVRAGYKRETEYNPVERKQKLNKLMAAASTRGLVLLIDEAHDMPAEVGRVFYDSAQAAAQDHPIMLVIAGTPDLESVLGRSGATFAERMNTKRIGRLSWEDTSRALVEPFGGTATFDDLARGVVVRETQGYPHFIQHWGSALWNVLARKGATHVGHEEVKEARKAFDQACRELYHRRLHELDGEGMLVPVAEIAFRIGEGGTPSRRDFMAITRKMAYARDQREAEEKLLHTGFIWQEDIGNWQFGIPSLAAHVRREAVSMVLERLREENALLSFRRVRSHFKRAPLLPISCLEGNLRTVLKETGRETMVEKHLAAFSRMGLLVPDPDMSKGHVALMAPLLTEAVIEEADRAEAKPEMEPTQEPTLQTRHEPDDHAPGM